MEESCPGDSVDCPSDELISAGTECRASTDQCDEVEVCTGADAACPVDDPSALDGETCDDDNLEHKRQRGAAEIVAPPPNAAFVFVSHGFWPLIAKTCCRFDSWATVVTAVMRSPGSKRVVALGTVTWSSRWIATMSERSGSSKS